MRSTRILAVLFAVAVVASAQTFTQNSLEVTSATLNDFKQKTQTTDYILFFFSTECNHCQQMYPEIEKLFNLVQNYNTNNAAIPDKRQLQLAHINGLKNRDLISTLQVEFYPTFIFFRNGLVHYYPVDSKRVAEDLLEFYTTNYYKVLPSIPGIPRLTLTMQGVSTFYTKMVNKYEELPEIFWAASSILALGLLLHPFLYRKNPFVKQE